MTDLEQRLVRLEHEVARLRRRNLLTAGGAIIVVTLACKARTEPPPPTSVRFGSVTLDDKGLTIDGKANRRITLDGSGLALADGDLRTTLVPGELSESGRGTAVRLAAVADLGGLSVKGDHESVVASVNDGWAGVTAEAVPPDLQATLTVSRRNGLASVTATAGAVDSAEVKLGGETGMFAAPAGAAVKASHGKDEKSLDAGKPQ